MKQRFQLRIRLGKNGRMRGQNGIEQLLLQIKCNSYSKSVISTRFADGQPCAGRYVDDAEFLAIVASLYPVAAKCTWEYEGNISKQETDRFVKSVVKYGWIWNMWDYKESRNMPGVAQRVPGGLGFQISWHSAREGGGVVSLTHRPPLPPGMFMVLIFTRGWVDPRAMVRSEGDMSLRNPVTQPGIDPEIVWLVAQRLNHYATPAP
jgi:hypothetical protein